ncbi:DinB family protein [Sabulilitoribacter multivorans]|uniref:DinB family protein n=1 Tax=Flaviramulus multivorans TaxID=1304750 RepID=A0ABS9IG63_9FLAO|nr:DinB family protein [Flaviramulus multivorans]MCF7559373.1 DinB family protein [Flaviramulus multivorans]
MEYSIDKAIEILEQTPKTITSFLENLSDEWILSDEGENTWRAFDVVGHLVHGEKTDWIPRLNIVLSSDDSKIFEPFDRFAQFEDSKGKSLLDLLHEFSELRRQNLNYLKTISFSKADFNLKAMHPELGEVTLKNLLATWVAHDLGHIAQIARVMAKQYKTEVGPWLAYIPILNK